jgi:hypothetical protein
MEKIFRFFSVSPLIHVKFKKKVQWSFIHLKYIKNDKTKQPIMPSFVLYIVVVYQSSETSTNQSDVIIRSDDHELINFCSVVAYNLATRDKARKYKSLAQ